MIASVSTVAASMPAPVARSMTTRSGPGFREPMVGWCPRSRNCATIEEPRVPVPPVTSTRTPPIRPHGTLTASLAPARCEGITRCEPMREPPHDASRSPRIDCRPLHGSDQRSVPLNSVDCCDSSCTDRVTRKRARRRAGVPIFRRRRDRANAAARAHCGGGCANGRDESGNRPNGVWCCQLRMQRSMVDP